MEKSYVFVVSNDCTIGTPEGLLIRLKKGAIWASDDPVVRHRPDFFADEPPADSIIRSTPDTPAEMFRRQVESWPTPA